jgi:nicotinate phosphoribosyltransferase
MNGVRTAIEVIRELELSGDLAVRIDSGDLLALSKATRATLDEAGLPDVRIVVSGGLDEWDLDRLVRSGAPIDAFGVGTRVGVSADAPTLDSAYKLVEYDGAPTVKLSENKASVPGRKQVFRGPAGDRIGLRDEALPDGHEPLLVPVMRGGERTGPARTLETARALFRADLEQVSAESRRIDDPVAHVPRSTVALDELSDTARRQARTRAGI